MLSVKQLEANKKKFLETNEKYGIFSNSLLEFLGEDFYTCPATSKMDMYGCYPGGLLNHLIKVAKYSIRINEMLPDYLIQPVGSIIRTVFLSQIGKVFMFCPNQNDWEIKNLGKLYDFCNQEISMKVGERSIYYIFKNGGQLNEVEYQAILNLDKDGNDKMSKYYSEPLTQIIRQGADLAIMEEKENGKKQNI